MSINKTNLMAGLASGIVIGGLTLGAIGVSAQDSGDRESFSDKLATEFNLDANEVETFLEEQKAERKAMFEQKKAEHLQSLVDDGTITEEQKTQIEEWMAERQAEREAAKEDRLSKEEWQALSDEEREALKAEKEAAREERQAEAEAFFESIGVDMDDIKGDFDGKHKRGFRGGRF